MKSAAAPPGRQKTKQEFFFVIVVVVSFSWLQFMLHFSSLNLEDFPNICITICYVGNPCTVSWQIVPDISLSGQCTRTLLLHFMMQTLEIMAVINGISQALICNTFLLHIQLHIPVILLLHCCVNTPDNCHKAKELDSFSMQCLTIGCVAEQ